MINSVEMTNWRAYDHCQINFDPGITFIMGSNGIGKTSILEAIAYALAGEPSTVERTKLLRDPEKVATVRLSFTVDGQEYSVERSQTSERAGNATLNRVSEKKSLASNQTRVTAKIEELMGVSADFLRRIVYMAEGDVFRFLDEPPGKAIDTQIRRVLGLTQMDEFIKALESAEKELKVQIKTIQDLLGDLTKLNVRQGQDLDLQISEMDERREALLADLRSAQGSIAELKRENEDIVRLAPMLDKAAKMLRQDIKGWQAAQQVPVMDLFQRLEQRLQTSESEFQSAQVTQARLEGEQSAYQRIIEILAPYAGRDETLPCPVCAKPMTSAERGKIVQDIQGVISRITNDLQLLQARQQDLQQACTSLREQVNGLRELRNSLAHIRFQSINSSASLSDLLQSVPSHQADFQQRLNKLQQEVSAFNQMIAGLEREKAEYLAVQMRLQNMGYTSPEEASESLVRLETRSLALRAASQAAQATLTAQRNADMPAIYDQVAKVWQTFLGKDNWRVELDEDGMPVLYDGEGRRFDLSQFSGGEKTALLIMLHTIIAHHFSKSDFLLVDEPLEHLDPVNRRSLVNFLVSAYRRGGFRQAIVATFEESLVRKYMSDEGVNIIHL